MFDMKKAGAHLKRFCGMAAVIAVAAAAIFNAAADDIRLLRQLDNNYEGIMPAPENGVEDIAAVNINTASVHHLQRIKGIGEVRARAIVEYREAHGAFGSVEELVNVSGIGEKTLDAIRGRVTV